jgi:hypothetical protein
MKNNKHLCRGHRLDVVVPPPPPSSTTPFVLTVNVDISSVIAHLDTMHIVALEVECRKRRCTIDDVLQPLETPPPRRLYWVGPPNPGHIWSQKEYTNVYEARLRWILGVDGVDVAIVDGRISMVFASWWADLLAKALEIVAFCASSFIEKYCKSHYL